MPTVTFFKTIVMALLLLPFVFRSLAAVEPDEHSITRDYGFLLMEGNIGKDRKAQAHIWFSPGIGDEVLLWGILHDSQQPEPTRIQGTINRTSEEQRLQQTMLMDEGDEVIGRLEVTWRQSYGSEPVTMSGFWISGIGTIKLPIKLMEVSAPDSVPLDFHCFAESYRRQRGHEFFERSQCVVFPQLRSDKESHRRINAIIRHWVQKSLIESSKDPDISSPAPSMQEIERAVQASLPKRKSLELMEINRIETVTHRNTFEVLLNESGLLCLRLAFNEDLGGAHDMFWARHLIFDLLSGRELKIEDELKSGWYGEVKALAESSVRRQFGLKPGNPLTSPGPLSAENFELNENWFISAEGLGFYFDPYEIASFASGAITPIIPLKKLKNMIRTGSPLEALAQPYSP